MIQRCAIRFIILIAMCVLLSHERELYAEVTSSTCDLLRYPKCMAFHFLICQPPPRTCMVPPFVNPDECFQEHDSDGYTAKMQYNVGKNYTYKYSEVKGYLFVAVFATDNMFEAPVTVLCQNHPELPDNSIKLEDVTRKYSMTLRITEIQSGTPPITTVTLVATKDNDNGITSSSNIPKYQTGSPKFVASVETTLKQNTELKSTSGFFSTRSSTDQRTIKGQSKNDKLIIIAVPCVGYFSVGIIAGIICICCCNPNSLCKRKGFCGFKKLSKKNRNEQNSEPQTRPRLIAEPLPNAYTKQTALLENEHIHVVRDKGIFIPETSQTKDEQRIDKLLGASGTSNIGSEKSYQHTMTRDCYGANIVDDEDENKTTHKLGDTSKKNVPTSNPLTENKNQYGSTVFATQSENRNKKGSNYSEPGKETEHFVNESNRNSYFLKDKIPIVSDLDLEMDLVSDAIKYNGNDFLVNENNMRSVQDKIPIASNLNPEMVVESLGTKYNENENNKKELSRWVWQIENGELQTEVDQPEQKEKKKKQNGENETINDDSTSCSSDDESVETIIDDSTSYSSDDESAERLRQRLDETNMQLKMRKQEKRNRLEEWIRMKKKELGRFKSKDCSGVRPKKQSPKLKRAGKCRVSRRSDGSDNKSSQEGIRRSRKTKKEVNQTNGKKGNTKTDDKNPGSEKMKKKGKSKKNREQN